MRRYSQCWASRSRRRGATLTVTLIAGLASTIFVPLTTALLTAGPKTTLVSLSLLLLLTGLWVGRHVPHGKLVAAPVVPQPFTPDVLFARLTGVFTLACIVTVGVGLQLAPLLLASGQSPAVAAGLTGLMGLAALPGRVIFTPLLHLLGAQPFTVWLLGCLGIGTLLLHVTSVLPLMVAGIVVFGMINGALTLARSELLINAYRPEHYGTANGRLARPVNLAQALTPFGVGLLFALTDGYDWSLTILGGLAGISAWSLDVAAPTAAWAPQTSEKTRPGKVTRKNDSRQCRLPWSAGYVQARMGYAWL